MLGELLEAGDACHASHEGEALARGQSVEAQSARLDELGGITVRVLQVVSQHVSVEVRLLVEALVAALQGASEWLLSCVDPQVSLKVEVQRELLPAELALVWLLTLGKSESPGLLCEPACGA